MDGGTVIYYGGFALPDKSASANRVVSNGKLFNSLGYNTVFLGASDGGESGVKKISDNMYVQPRAKSAYEWFKRITDTTEVMKLAEERPDTKIIILYNTPFISLLRFKRKLKRTNIELVYDCTEWTGDTDGGMLKRIFKKADEFFVRNFAARAADKIIAVSSLMERKYEKHAPVLRLPPLVDIQDGIWRQQKLPSDDGFQFCFAGVPDGKKESLDAVVKAFAMIESKTASLRIAGVTKEQFVALYPGVDVPDNVIFSGMVSHAQAIQYVLSSQCYIFIRQSDRRNNAGFPTKFAESFTSGVPIVTTDVSDVGEYIKTPRDGAVLPSVDEKLIHSAMIDIMSAGYAPRELRTDFDYRSYIRKTAEWLEK